MIEETVKVKVVKTKLETVDDVWELVQWALSTPGVYVTVAARVDNELYIEVGATESESVRPRLGDTLFWDGVRFRLQ